MSKYTKVVKSNRRETNKKAAKTDKQKKSNWFRDRRRRCEQLSFGVPIRHPIEFRALVIEARTSQLAPSSLMNPKQTPIRMPPHDLPKGMRTRSKFATHTIVALTIGHVETMPFLRHSSKTIDKPRHYTFIWMLQPHQQFIQLRPSGLRQCSPA